MILRIRGDEMKVMDINFEDIRFVAHIFGSCMKTSAFSRTYDTPLFLDIDCMSTSVFRAHMISFN